MAMCPEESYESDLDIALDVEKINLAFLNWSETEGPNVEYKKKKGKKWHRKFGKTKQKTYGICNSLGLTIHPIAEETCDDLTKYDRGGSFTNISVGDITCDSLWDVTNPVVDFGHSFNKCEDLSKYDCGGSFTDISEDDGTSDSLWDVTNPVVGFSRSFNKCEDLSKYGGGSSFTNMSVDNGTSNNLWDMTNPVVGVGHSFDKHTLGSFESTKARDLVGACSLDYNGESNFLDDVSQEDYTFPPPPDENELYGALEQIEDPNCTSDTSFIECLDSLERDISAYLDSQQADTSTTNKENNEPLLSNLDINIQDKKKDEDIDMSGKRLYLTDHEMIQIESMYTSLRSTVHVCGCEANLYFFKFNTEQPWELKFTGVPIIVFRRGERTNEVTIGMAELGTGLRYWSDILTFQTAYFRHTDSFHSFNLSKNNCEMVGLSFDCSRPATRFYYHITELSSHIENIGVSLPKHVKTRRRPKRKLPSKKEISSPCCFRVITKVTPEDHDRYASMQSLGSMPGTSRGYVKEPTVTEL